MKLSEYYGELKSYSIKNEVLVLIAIEESLHGAFDKSMYDQDEITLELVGEFEELADFLETAIGENFTIDYYEELGIVEIDLSNHYDENKTFFCKSSSYKKVEFTVDEWKQRYYNLEMQRINECNKLLQQNRKIQNKVREFTNLIEKKLANSTKKISFLEKANTNKVEIEKVRNDTYSEVLKTHKMIFEKES